MFSVGLKLVPCLLLTYLSLALIRVLIEAEKRKVRLKQNVGYRRPEQDGTSSTPVTKALISSSGHSNTNLTIPVTGNVSSTSSGVSCGHATALLQVPVKKALRTSGQPCGSSHHQPSDRTTKMLLAILLLFLITEFPSGILTLLSGIIGESFFQNVYQPLGEIIDILALINSGINFILYCAMSRLFRKTFTKVFCHRQYDSRYATNVPNNEYTNCHSNRKMSNGQHLLGHEFGSAHAVHTTVV